MPYIDESRRAELDPVRTLRTAVNPGELNYQITRLCDYYLNAMAKTQYSDINEIIGVLECAKLEFYRRIAAPYEDRKREENGDVYVSQV